MNLKDVAIIIPARIGSARLPRKPLETIGHKTLIEHVVHSIKKAGFANIYVATDSKEISDVVKNSGIEAIMTDEACPSGTDRIYQAFQKLPNHDKIKYIINIQGDMPFVNGAIVKDIIQGLASGEYDIMTSVVKIDHATASSPDNVKVVVTNKNKALYFSRLPIPYGGQEFLYHVGIYGFTPEGLERFVSMAQSKYEKTEKLEQLRALENGMNIGICYCDEVPISVDTASDLEKAREYFTKMGTGLC
jgi:3-deoxy-manno-octulosonate cytidylyltransferase (CMP-KDO synthetase)